MKTITHDFPFVADVALIGRIVKPGELVEVTDEQAAVLLENAAFREVKAENTTTGKVA